jgi:hypothetical protein
MAFWCSGFHTISQLLKLADWATMFPGRFHGIHNLYVSSHPWFQKID